MTGPWERDLLTDLKVVSAWRTRAVITLMEDHELVQLGVPAIGETTRSLGMTWYHLPIREVSVPDSVFETAWKKAGAGLRQRLIAGERILIHCRGGLGRTGLIAARLLIELGESPGRALRCVRKERPGGRGDTGAGGLCVEKGSCAPGGAVIFRQVKKSKLISKIILCGAGESLGLVN